MISIALNYKFVEFTKMIRKIIVLDGDNQTKLRIVYHQLIHDLVMYRFVNKLKKNDSAIK